MGCVECHSGVRPLHFLVALEVFVLLLLAYLFLLHPVSACSDIHTPDLERISGYCHDNIQKHVNNETSSLRVRVATNQWGDLADRQLLFDANESRFCSVIPTEERLLLAHSRSLLLMEELWGEQDEMRGSLPDEWASSKWAAALVFFGKLLHTLLPHCAEVSEELKEKEEADEDYGGRGNSNGEEKALQFPVSLDLERPKRARTTFTEEQVRELEAAFARDGYLVGEARRSLALRLQLSDTQVKVWFQNRRTKNRKKGTESSREEKTSPREQPLPVFLGAMSWLPPLSFLADNSSPMRS